MKWLLICLVAVLLTACGGGGGDSSGSPTPTNTAPVGNAGPAQSVTTATVVILDGSASGDADGDSLTFVWNLTTKPPGSAATLTGVTLARASFTADVVGTYVASLVVNDGKTNSATSTVSVTATVQNSAPAADAGVAQTVVTGTFVKLDGSTSSDPDGDQITYSWALTDRPVGSAALVASANSAKPSFTADVAGTYVASLVVNDGRSKSNSSTVSVTATDPIVVKAATILVDTVWTAATYLLDGVVSVAPTATLTISPGSLVVGRDMGSRLLVSGSLIAIGTSEKRITFGTLPAQESGFQARKFGGVFLANSSNSRIEFVVFENAAREALSLDGTSVVALRNVLFRNNEWAITDSFGYQFMDIQYCSFIENSSVFFGIRPTVGSVFAMNDFRNNTSVFEMVYPVGPMIINNNNFIANETVVRAPEVSGTFGMKNNWWGTVDEATIELLIYDFLDLSTLQRVEYSPVLLAPAQAGSL